MEFVAIQWQCKLLRQNAPAAVSVRDLAAEKWRRVSISRPTFQAVPDAVFSRRRNNSQAFHGVTYQHL
jgi:hypothetical protein